MWEQWATWTGCPESFWMSHPGSVQGFEQTGLAKDVPAHGWSLPAQTVLWLSHELQHEACWSVVEVTRMRKGSGIVVSLKWSCLGLISLGQVCIVLFRFHLFFQKTHFKEFFSPHAGFCGVLNWPVCFVV